MPKRHPPLLFATSWLLLLAIACTSTAADLTVRGFLGTIENAEIIPGSAPAQVDPVAKTRAGRDALELERLAQWSLNYLVGSVTAEKDFASSYGNWPLSMPPFAIGGDTIAIGDSEVRNLLAFVLARQMSGIRDGAEIQEGVKRRVLKCQHPCGLFTPESHGDTDVLWATAWVTRALLEEYATAGDRESLALAGKALQAVRRHAVESNSQGLLRLAPPKDLLLDGQPIHFAYRPELDFCIVEPMLRYYEVTGDREMLAVAQGLIDGRLAGYSQHDTSHTHSFWHGVISIAHLGAITHEAKYLDWVEQRLAEWSSLYTDYGWFEAVRGYGSSETCAVADLLHVSVYLGRGGRTSHYDLVERTLRNYLPQEQFFLEDEPFLTLWRQKDYADRELHRALMRRLEGGFYCRTTPVDRWAEKTISLEGCCPPTGVTGLYIAWHDIVRKTDDGVLVNLAFNHDCPEAQVISYLPQQGRLTVVPKQTGMFAVRVPGFVPREQVAAWRDGQRQNHVTWNNDYVAFPSARVGDELTITYPLVRFVQKAKAAGVDHTIHWVGNALMDIEPKGTIWPLFAKIPYPTPPYRGLATAPIPPELLAAQPATAVPSRVTVRLPEIVLSDAMKAGYTLSDWQATETQLTATLVWHGKHFGGAVPKFRLLDAEGKELSGDRMVALSAALTEEQPCQIRLALDQPASTVAKVLLYLVSPTEKAD